MPDENCDQKNSTSDEHRCCKPEKLAKVHKNRPITKYIAVKYHHFRQAVKDKMLYVAINRY
eukprot:5584337-Ditylum_brightwellii.AAC.1